MHNNKSTLDGFTEQANEHLDAHGQATPHEQAIPLAHEVATHARLLFCAVSSAMCYGDVVLASANTNNDYRGSFGAGTGPCNTSLVSQTIVTQA